MSDFLILSDEDVRNALPMLDLHKRLPQASNEHERTLLEPRIRTTDNQIDALVYELYGLTEDEIAIVEDVAS